MVTFVTAVFLLIISPGPGVLTTAGTGAAYGYSAGLSYVTGLFIGNNLVALIVVSGLAAILFATPGLATVLLFLSVAYLVYLAAKIAFAGSHIGFAQATSPPSLLDGVMLQFINPKAYIVSTTLFSGFRFLPDTPGFEIIAKLLLFNAVWVPIHLAWLWAGVTLHKLDLSPTSQRTINFAMAASLLGVVALAFFSAR